MLISPEYRQLNSELHARRDTFGSGCETKKWYPHILKFVEALNAKTILDYGAGKSALGKIMSHLMIASYDPAIPGIDEPPEPADMVVCLDVLEHVEPDCIDEVLDDLKRCTIHGIFLTVNMWPAGKTLKDGRNAHLIQMPPSWWLPKIVSRWDLKFFSAIPKEFNLFALNVDDIEARNKKAMALSIEEFAA